MPTKRSSSRSSRQSRKSRNAWSSSVIGSHATPRHSSAKSNRSWHKSSKQPIGRPSVRITTEQPTRRRAASSVSRRSAEINQVQVHTHSVDQRTGQYASNKSRAQEFMKRRRTKNILLALVVVVVVIALLFNIASCAFKTFTSASMALDNSELESELVSVADGKAYNILLVGLSDNSQSTEAASFIAVLRIDEQNNKFSLLKIPNNIVTTFNQRDQDLLRNAISYGGEAQLLRCVEDLTDMEFAHYVQVTESGLETLVDDIGGVDVNVEYRVDDPRVGTVTILPGQQILSGKQAIAYLSATNYQAGRTQRTNNQWEFFTALIGKLTSSEGFGWISDSDIMSNAIKTDMSYDTLSNLATLYSQGVTLYTATMPGSQYLSNNVVCFSPTSSSWEDTKQRFENGEDINTAVDTSGVEKDKLSIIVQNGSGTDGFASQAASILEANGYTIQDTGNADSFVYTETLVIYRSEEDEAAAEAIVADLGVGRAVSAGVYYSLKTDIQVVVGQDWKPVG